MREFAVAQKSTNTLKPSAWATWLGYAGLIPFVAFALGVQFLSADLRDYCVFALTAYAATITSFLGAIHWGLAMRDTQSTSFLGAIHWGLAMRDTQSTSSLSSDTASSNAALYAWGVVPSLAAWVALLLAIFSGPVVALCVLGVLLWVCYVVDRSIYPKFQLQNWLPMRLNLTLVASMSCFYAAAQKL